MGPKAERRELGRCRWPTGGCVYFFLFFFNIISSFQCIEFFSYVMPDNCAVDARLQ